MFGPFALSLFYLKKSPRSSIPSLFPADFWMPINWRWWPSYWSLLSRGTKLSSLLSLSSFHFSGSATSSIPSHLSLMAENSATNGNHDIVLNVNGDLNRVASKANHERSGMSVSVPFLQKVSITTLLFLYICSKPL